MKIVVAIDSFKGSLSTFESGAAVKEAAERVFGNVQVKICPLADGGEGTVNAVVYGKVGKLCRATVKGPLGQPVDAEYGVAGDTAIIEMSAAAGITLIGEDERNPLITTTYGVGELIFHAIRENGCRKFIVGIGGSATNDGGVGMLSALGFKFLDREDREIPMGASGLASLDRIITDGAMPELAECEFYIACDVKNPLCGENGCSAIYGPQKGATEQMIKDMDGWLGHYAELTAKTTGHDNRDLPGAGAAGGLGFAFISYLGGSLESGIGLVMREFGLERELSDADLVITGEGRLDSQSCMGKAPVGVAQAAKKHGKTVIAFCGSAADDAALCNEYGIDAFFPIVQAPTTLADAMNKENAYRNLKATAEQTFRLIRSIQK
jgi:glycerate kinase